MTELTLRNRGSSADYRLGMSEGWDAFAVVRWHAIEQISRPFEYDITLLRQHERGPADLDSLLDTGATFAIATEHRWRLVHGVIAEAEEIDRTREIFIYRVLLVPHLWRAKYRRRCRTFVDKSLEEVVGTVLENRAPAHPEGMRGLARLVDMEAAPAQEQALPAFREPRGRYRWAIRDGARLSAPRPFIVQYNESDFDFVSRLLEAEGLSYFFEHAGDDMVMTLTDRPGRAPLIERHPTFRLRGLLQMGTSRSQEVLRTLGSIRRLRSHAVTMRDVAWRKSSLLLEATSADPTLPEELGHFEFPARDEDDPKEPGAAPARSLMERFSVERALTTGSGTLRTMEPGLQFQLRDDDGLRDDAELLIVRVETFASELLPEGTPLDLQPFGFSGSRGESSFFENRFQVLPSDVVFRPERITTKPQIAGIHRAVVTTRTGAEQGPPELNSDEWGRVQVRFRWDQRPSDGTASSKYIRVSQSSAGSAFGAFHVPRVGQEVLVAFENGDPDRPVVVGRVYNGDNPPPIREADTTKSTLKSDSVGANGESATGFNEIRMDDLAGAELLELHAHLDFKSQTGRNSDTRVGVNQSLDVGGRSTVHIAGGHSVSAGSVSISTGPYKLNASTIAANAKDTMTLTAGDVRRDKSVNHFIDTGGLWVKAKSIVQMIAPKLFFQGDKEIQLVSGGSSITITPDSVKLVCGGSAITMTRGETTIISPMIKLNC